jgi:thiol-disulfide isomerase/thioredoxin
VIPGLVVSACALVAATAFGFGWRNRNGRVRAIAPRAAGVSARSATPAAGLSAQSASPAAGLDASFASPAAGLSAPSASPAADLSAQSAPSEPGLTAGDLGAPLGSRATLVQFSSAFCAPCRATQRILSDVAVMVDGVSHVEIDAESRLDLVRRLDVRRTPTTFVLGPGGEITHRASGKPRKADVIAALGAVV